MKIKKILILVLSLFLSFSLFSCKTITTTSSKNTLNREDGALKIEIENYELFVGEQVRVSYSKNYDLSNATISYYSSNTSVFTVSTSGYIKAISEGKAKLTISYGNEEYYQFVTVYSKPELIYPERLVYSINDELDLTGAILSIYDKEKQEFDIIPVTMDMVTGFNSSTPGTKELTVTYLDYVFKFNVSVVSIDDAEIYKFKLDEDITLNQNTVNTLKLTSYYPDRISEMINSPYDYNEMEIRVEFLSPSGEKDTVYHYYTQDYTESHTIIGISSSNRIEGQVNLSDEFKYKTILTKDGNPYYAIRYNPRETGEYSYLLYVTLNNTDTVYETSGRISVLENDSDSDGVIHISDNKRTYVFDSGKSYIPLGTNMAWYTSKDRRYNDFTMWLSEANENGVNYIRYWLSAWESALFWDNIENYSTRLDEAYEVDKILEMCEEYGIYMDLTLYHHGMFSDSVNPMWKGSSNSWYNQQYGYNPWSDKVSTPLEFFTDDYARKWTKNYIKYIIARYGSSDAIMSYELMNELDWVVDPKSTDTVEWHKEMATFIKDTDYNKRIVTTSLGRSYGTDNLARAIFSLDEIEYVNLHVYMAWNFLTQFPNLAPTAYNLFNKPVMVQECGYNGNGGADQHNSDPSDTSLHAQIWAGIMTTSASGMPWWWDSWLYPYNSYKEFKGASKLIGLMNLEGSFEQVAQSSKVSLTGSASLLYGKKMGYLFKDRAYIYCHHKDYSVNSGDKTLENMTLKVTLDPGTYIVDQYNTFTGERVKSSTELINTSGTVQFSVSFTNDTFIVINKK